MSLIKKSELKNMDVNQINDRIMNMQKDLLKLNAQRAVGTTIESPGKIKLIKRTIGRLLTLKNSKLNKVEGGSEKK